MKRDSTQPYPRAFVVLGAIGTVVMLHGIIGLLKNAVVTTPVATARSLGTAVLVNDLVVMPFILLAGVLTTLFPRVLRPPIRAALTVSAVVIMFAVWGSVGQRRDVQLGNPTVLRNNYVASVIIILGPVWALAIIAAAVAAIRSRSARSAAPAQVAAGQPQRVG